MSLIIPAPSRIISLEEAAGFPPVSKPRVVDRDMWKGVLRASGRYADVKRMEKAEAKRARKAPVKAPVISEFSAKYPSERAMMAPAR